jgi:hypothetical protein
MCAAVTLLVSPANVTVYVTDLSGLMRTSAKPPPVVGTGGTSFAPLRRAAN